MRGIARVFDVSRPTLTQWKMSRKADETYHHPTMTYLRDSGAIEAAADQIVLLFTDTAHPLSPNKKNPAFGGYSQLEIVAHRNGATGFLPLYFVGKYQQVSDWEGAVPTHSVASSSKPKPRSL